MQSCLNFTFHTQKKFSRVFCWNKWMVMEGTREQFPSLLAAFSNWIIVMRLLRTKSIHRKWWSRQLNTTETMSLIFIKCPFKKKTSLGSLGAPCNRPEQSLTTQPCLKRIPTSVKAVYSLSSRKQGRSIKKKNIYKSRLWCQINETWVMNHVLGREGSDFYYHDCPVPLFSLPITVPLTRFKFNKLYIWKSQPLKSLWNTC